jgi:prenylcysteine oxidase / farnesylcysteine lyase
METETISARNVVDLLLNEEFGTGICGPRIASQAQNLRDAYNDYQQSETFVYGWDC